MFRVKSVFLTLQGEGVHAGRAAVFLRFAGCNLWSGREADRGASCSAWCDTDFLGGVPYPDPDALADAVAAEWRGGRDRLVVLTGGEPTLQARPALVAALYRRNFRVAIETNGTKAVHRGQYDWVTASPKAGAPLLLTWADELKLAFPQPGAMPGDLAEFNASHRFLQPIDGPDLAANTRAAVDYCLGHPEWRLGLQAHKLWGLP